MHLKWKSFISIKKTRHPLFFLPLILLINSNILKLYNKHEQIHQILSKIVIYFHKSNGDRECFWNFELVTEKRLKWEERGLDKITHSPFPAMERAPQCSDIITRSIRQTYVQLIELRIHPHQKEIKKKSIKWKYEWTDHPAAERQRVQVHWIDYRMGCWCEGCK